MLYSNQPDNAKRFKARRYYLPKSIIKNINVTINGKNFYDQPIDADIKRYKEIRKLTTGQGENYPTGCLLDYEYIKNHYRLIAVDMSRQKKIICCSKGTSAIKKNQIVGQLKKLDANGNVGNDQKIKEQIKETRLKFQGGITVVKKMGNYEEARVKLTNSQLNKLKSAAKNKTGIVE